MKLHIIFGQRKCRYAGEYAPEALDIADEYTMEENPDWLSGKLKEHRDSGDFASVEVLIVRVPDKAVDDALAPRAPEVDGSVA